MHKIIWLTGLPCSGKTTIARALAKRIGAEVLDGDEIRRDAGNKDFSPEGRERHMLSVAERAYNLSSKSPVIVSLVSPIRRVRERIKGSYPNVREVWVKCPLEECIKRDVKGMYRKALAGKIKQFTGISAPYEPPRQSLTVDTSQLGIDECVDRIMREYSLMAGGKGKEF